MAAFKMTESLPPVVRYLLYANVIVFILQYVFLAQGIDLSNYFALWSVNTGNFRIWQLITHMFLHGGFFHILFNMFGLWMFGSFIERQWGSKRFFQMYMISGVIAGLAQMLLYNGGFPSLGASGAIMGVFATFAVLFPEMPLYLYFIPIPIKAKWALPGLMALDLFGAISPHDNVAHWAHIGGALTGLAFALAWKRRYF